MLPIGVPGARRKPDTVNRGIGSSMQTRRDSDSDSVCIIPDSV